MADVARLDELIEKREKEQPGWLWATFLAPLAFLFVSFLFFVVMSLLGDPMESWQEETSRTMHVLVGVLIMGWFLQRRHLADLKAVREALADGPADVDVPLETETTGPGAA